MLELDKIYNMDCLDGMKQLEDNSIDLIVTDPPYGINYQSNMRKKKFDKIVQDDNLNWLEPTFSEFYHILNSTGALYCFTRWDKFEDFKESIAKVFKIKSVIVWDKLSGGMGDLNGAYAPSYEICIFAVKEKHELRGKRPKDLIRCGREIEYLHPTQKPIKLIEKLIKTSSDENDTVFDPFMGSGTTAVACKKLNRRFIGFEISKEYCDIAEKRLANAPERLDKWF